MQGPPTASTDQAEAPIPTETVSMSNGSRTMKTAPIPTETASMSNDPTMKAEAPIPTATVSNGNEQHLIDDTVPLHRKAAKRTLPWDQAAGELLVSQDEDNPARKKLRLEEPLLTATDEAARRTASPDVSVGPPPSAVDIAEANANAESVTETQPNTGASSRATGSWT
jgi:hypothetical protein